MAAAELRLQVGLDLAFFRQQLAQLASASVGYSLPINIDRLAIQKEITKLGRNISSRKYTLKIDTTVKSAASDISNLQKALEELEKKSVNVQITGTGNLNAKEAKKIRTALRASVLANGGKIEIPTTIKAAITQGDIRDFKNAVKSKLTGLSVDVKANVQGKGFAGTEQGYEGLMGYMQKQGLIGKTASGMTMQMGKNGDDIKQQLGDAVKSAEKIKSIFDGVAQSIATTGKSTANVQGKRLSLGNVPLMAGGVERRIEQSSAAIGATLSADALKALYPEVSKTIASFVALKGQIQQNTSKLSGFSLILGLAAFAGVPLAKSVVKLTGSADSFAKLLDQLGLKLDAAFTKAAFNILSATSGRMLSGGSVAGLLPAAYRGIGGSAGPAGLLPPAYRGIGSSRNAGALPPAYRGLPAAYRGIGASAGVSGLLPPAYRGIGASRNAGAIGGTAFGSQKYLPTALGDETKKVLRDAAYAFLRVMREEMRKVVYQVNVRDLGQAINRQSMLSGGRTAGYLPPVARFGVGRDPNPYSTGRLGREGETQAELFARREREARIKSAFREMDVMGGGAGRTAASYNYAYRAARPTSAMVPYAAGGALVTGGGAPPAPPTPPSGGRGGFGSFGGFRGAMPNVSLPGVGLVRELGDQFGYAAKQVLLFGTTYKALAFLTDFPVKVGEAVAQLQTFRNTLQSITPSADEFQKSNQFILDTVDKYNTPLQSARDGFTKLYASMAPAGFKGDDIRNIFAGISQGAATFGMSADKVDRVNYAFAQMASKGQVMSEELKGQLGDVLPGAVAIFAKAAGFEGPEAMVKFTKAMEDGRYKGEAMKQLLINVGIVMKDKFAAGAEGAAQTFQGQMNAMANATKKLYEAFVPAGNLFSSQIIAPFTSGLQVLADGFNAFFSGVAAQTAGGFALSQELEKLRPTIKGIMDNITQLMPVLQSFATTLLGLGKILLQIAGNPFVGYLLRVYLAVLPLTMAIQALNLQALVPMIASFVRAIPVFIAYRAATLQGASANKALQMSMVLTGQSAGVTAGKIRLVGTALKSVFVGTLVGAVALGIGMIIEKMATLSSKMAEARANALQLGNSIRVMSKTELQVAQNKLGRQEVMLRNLQTQGKGQKYVPLNKQQENMLMELAPGAITRVTRNTTGLEPVTKRGAGMGMGMAAIDPAMVQSVQQKIITLRQNIQSARADLAATDQTATVLAPIPSASGAGTSGGAAKPSAAAKAELQAQQKLRALTREIELAAQLATLKELQFEAETAGDRELQIRLQGEERSLGILHATASALDGITNSELRQKELAKAESQILGERQNVTFNLARFEDERTKSFEDVIADLNLELKLKQATTEEAREQLRLEAERIKLTKQKLFTPEQIGAIMQKKGELARPQTDGEKVQARIDELRKGLDELTNPANTLIGIAGSIGDSFGNAFKGIIDGSMTAQQALAGFFQNLSNYFADAVSKMIAEWLKIEALKGLKSLLPNLFGGGGFGFTGDSGLGATAFGSGFQVPGFEFANGGIAPGGFRAFASGGIVTGPTMGLVGEGRYNEAVIPLPDGKSVPVDLGGLSGGMSSAPITVNVSVDAKDSAVQGDTAQSAALGRVIAASVQAELIKQKRPGGILSK